MTPAGLPYAAAWLCWLISVLGNATLLLHVAPKFETVRVIRLAVIAIVSSAVLLVAVVIGLWAVGAHPTSEAVSLIFSVFFALVVMAMSNIGLAMFRLAAEGVTAFHDRYNDANLQRFPISVLIKHRRTLYRAAAVVWCIGSGLMLYGVWFDMRV